jgi:hypothetical protein
VVLRQISVEDARADIAIHRRGNAVSVQVLDMQGEIEVSALYSG